MKRIRIIFTSIIFILAICFVQNNTAYAEPVKVSSLAEFRNVVYKDMLQRKDSIEVEYSGEDYKSIFEKFEKEEFINDLGMIDDVNNSDDFDYMIQNVSYMKTSMKGITSSKVLFSIEIKWRETLGQLEYVNLQVKDIIEKQKITETDSAYQRIKLVHDYIVENVEYDSSLIHENAYSALKDKTSTCQGYSLLFYKMLTEVGIPCRYITGTGINEKDTGPHGWNIVKIGDLWYNVDVTWDDPIYTDPSYKSKEICRDYFLKGSKNFDSSHIRDAEFTNPMFMSEYVMDKEDFNIANDVSIAEMVLGNSDITQMMLEVPKTPKKEEGIKGILQDVKEWFDNAKESIANGTLKEYIVDSYNELEDKDKAIIIGLLAVLLISIVYKIYRSTVDRKEQYDEYDDQYNKYADYSNQKMEATNIDDIASTSNHLATSSSRKNNNMFDGSQVSDREKTSNRLDNVKRPIGNVSRSMEDTKRPIGSASKSIEDLKRPVGSVSKGIEDAKRPVESASKGIDDNQHVIKSADEGITEIKSPIESRGMIIDNTNDNLEISNNMNDNDIDGEEKDIRNLNNKQVNKSATEYNVGRDIYDKKDTMDIDDKFNVTYKNLDNVNQVSGSGIDYSSYLSDLDVEEDSNFDFDSYMSDDDFDFH